MNDDLEKLRMMLEYEGFRKWSLVVADVHALVGNTLISL